MHHIIEVHHVLFFFLFSKDLFKLFQQLHQVCRISKKRLQLCFCLCPAPAEVLLFQIINLFFPFFTQNRDSLLNCLVIVFLIFCSTHGIEFQIPHQFPCTKEEIKFVPAGNTRFRFKAHDLFQRIQTIHIFPGFFRQTPHTVVCQKICGFHKISARLTQAIIKSLDQEHRDLGHAQDIIGTKPFSTFPCPLKIIRHTSQLIV